MAENYSSNGTVTIKLDRSEVEKKLYEAEQKIKEFEAEKQKAELERQIKEEQVEIEKANRKAPSGSAPPNPPSN
jgi:multidrug resistance efflux pump